MQTTEGDGSVISWEQLPAAITTYLTAHRDRDVETALGALAGDATVTDEGRTHRGRDEVRTWLTRAGSGYTFTTRFTGATRAGDAHVDVRQRIEGDFPGGVADLHYRFTLDGDSITRLVIEP